MYGSTSVNNLFGGEEQTTCGRSYSLDDDSLSSSTAEEETDPLRTSTLSLPTEVLDEREPRFFYPYRLSKYVRNPTTQRYRSMATGYRGDRKGDDDQDSSDWESMEKIPSFMAPPFLFPSLDELSAIEDEFVSRKKSGTKAGRTALPRLTKKQKFTIFMLALANFCSTAVFSCIAPFFPLEAANSGATRIEVGLIFGIFELVVFLVSPVYGRYLDVIGPKFMYGAGIFITGTCSILFGLINMAPDGVPFVALCFAVRIVEAFGDAAFVTASFAIIAGEFPGRVATVVGLVETFAGLGFTAGPALGGIIYDMGGYSAPFVTFGAILFVAGALSVPFIPSQKLPPRKTSKGILSLLKYPSVLLLCLTTTVTSTCFSYLDPTLEAHLDNFSLSPSSVGLFFLISAGLYTLSAPIWGYLVDNKCIATELMIMGSFTSAVGLMLIGPSPIFAFDTSLWLVGISLAILGFGAAAAYIPTFKCTLDVALGFIGPTIGGAVVAHIGFEWASSIFALFNVLLGSLLVCYWISNRCAERKKLLLPYDRIAQYVEIDDGDTEKGRERVRSSI